MQKINLDLVIEKKAAADKAVEFIESGMIVGLGTGSTVKFFIENLAEKVKAGLFVDICDMVIIGRGKDCEIIEKEK